MKIGIISMQRHINLGSFLQAYGLKITLEKLGHEVEFIDVRLADGTFLNIPPKRKFIDYLKKCARPILHSKRTNIKAEKIESFMYSFFPILGLPDNPNIRTDYDAVVIGSDEVFSYAQFTKWGGTMMYFGKNVEAERIISYAGSFGYTNLEDLITLGVKDEVAGLFKKFRAVSVRDSNSVRLVEQLIEKTPDKHLDPVLISDYGSLVPQKIRHSNYILIYSYDDRLNEPEYINQVINFAKKQKKKIISVGGYLDWCDININVTPFELLAYFKNADFIVSETFHGTIFSIKYQKNFAVIVRDSNNNKLTDLLKTFNLEDRIITKDRNLDYVFASSYNSDVVSDRLKMETEKSIDYLRCNLCEENR